MSYKVDKAGGGPYAHEIDAIRDERYRANVMGVKPDFHSVFTGVISQGAYAVIRDIDKPIEAPVGDFVENVKFNDEEETASEKTPAESPVSGDTAAKESPAPASTGSESGNAESTPATVSVPTDSADNQPAAVVGLQDVLSPVTADNDTPIYVSMEADSGTPA